MTYRIKDWLPESVNLFFLKRDMPVSSKEKNEIAVKAAKKRLPKILKHALDNGGAVGKYSVSNLLGEMYGGAGRGSERKVECLKLLLSAGGSAHEMFVETVRHLPFDAINAYLDHYPAAVNFRCKTSSEACPSVQYYICPLVRVVYTGEPDRVKLLLDRGASPDDESLRSAQGQRYGDIVALLEEAIKIQQAQPSVSAVVAQQPPIAPDFNKGLDKSVTGAPMPEMKKAAFPGAAPKTAQS